MTEQRPLKFRAFDGKRMTQLDALILSYTNGWNIGRGEAAHLLYTPHKKVMQFTGLLDKNGVEVWEGDILGGWLGHGKSRKQYFHKIRWNEERACFELPAPLGKFEVIGNIYEHPHLLSEGGEGVKKIRNGRGFAGMLPEERRMAGSKGGKKFKPGTERMRELAKKRWAREVGPSY